MGTMVAWAQANEEALQGSRALPLRILRRALSFGLRRLGVPRADPIVTAVVHGAQLRLRRSHALPHIVRNNRFYDTALPAFVRYLHARSGNVLRLLDVGANIGDTAAIVASAAGAPNISFICVEADPLNIPFLQENTRGLSVEIIAALAGEETAKVAASFVRDHGTAYVTPGGSVERVVRLDDVMDLVRGAVNVIKIDTDGHELQVLRGLRATLARDKPYLYIEASPAHWEMVGGFPPLDTLTFLRRAGYVQCLAYDNVGYPIAECPLAADFIEHIINYARAKPYTYFDFLLSFNDDLRPFYEGELSRVGRSSQLF
jgi:FkbM family methyltransferase